MPKETVTYRKELVDGQEIEYFAHGAMEADGTSFMLSVGPVYIDAYGMGLIDKLRQLPTADQMKVLQMSLDDMVAEIETQQRFMNTVLHKVVIHNFFGHETGDKVDKKFLFEEWGWHSYANTVRNLKRGTMHIDLVNKLIEQLLSED
jgi:hypothetical protein